MELLKNVRCARLGGTVDFHPTKDLSHEKPEELARVRARYTPWEAEMEAADSRGPFRVY